MAQENQQSGWMLAAKKKAKNLDLIFITRHVIFPLDEKKKDYL